jgi:fructose-bisphosphate aldolase class II
MSHTRPANLLTLKEVLPMAEKGAYAVGAFSPRTLPLIEPVLRAGQKADSPLIVQISQREFERYGVTPHSFADEFYRQLSQQSVTVPVVLHLDHTREMGIIEEAVAAGFTSVMIDASEHPLEQNIALTRQAAAYAHPFHVSVEAELGRIGTTDFVETDQDEELYTDPDEAATFVAATGVDALAVSCGTAHGVYEVRQPKVDYARLQAIRARTPVHLVLHGGSGIPPAMVRRAIGLPNGGISKMNIATDVELAALAALGRSERLSSAEMEALPPRQLARAQTAVEQLVMEKMAHFLGSAGCARDPEWQAVIARLS